jgi:hypothetical protein
MKRHWLAPAVIVMKKRAGVGRAANAPEFAIEVGESRVVSLGAPTERGAHSAVGDLLLSGFVIPNNEPARSRDVSSRPLRRDARGRLRWPRE